MDISGTYPMLYAFFDEAGALRREAVSRQVAAAIASGSSGVAVLGLGTEVSKLGRGERRTLMEWTIAEVAGRKPVAVTIADGNVADMVESARAAHAAGASWLILQPPRPPATSADLVQIFGAVADSVDCPIGIQNAPEFLGIGLSAADLALLNGQHKNIVLVKAEASAVSVGRVIAELDGSMRVFNGRAGLELTDNYRAGVDGMIPGIETIDLQVAVERAMRAGDEVEAEGLYRRLLPAVCFIMQTLSHFVLYGKLIAALRLGIAPSATRAPSDTLTSLGESWARRLAAELGPLPA
jgi:4-hydroxy-tetrahydrodipicolinate synthase